MNNYLKNIWKELGRSIFIGERYKASDDFKWVYVKDDKSAKKFLEKHNADYILKDSEELL